MRTNQQTSGRRIILPAVIAATLTMLSGCGGSPASPPTSAAPSSTESSSSVATSDDAAASESSNDSTPASSALPAADPTLAPDLARVTVAGPNGIFRFDESGSVTTIATGAWAMAIALPDGLYAAQRQRPTFLPHSLGVPDVITVEDQALYRVEAGKDPIAVLPAPSEQTTCTAPPPLGQQDPVTVSFASDPLTFQRLDGALASTDGSRTALLWVYTPKSDVQPGDTRLHDSVAVDLLTGDCVYGRAPQAASVNGGWLLPDNAAVQRVSFGLRFYLYVQDDGTTRLVAPQFSPDDPKSPNFLPSDFGLEDAYLVGQFAGGRPAINAAAVDEGQSGSTITRVGFIVGNHLSVFAWPSKELVFETDLPELAGQEQYELELTQTAALVDLVDWAASSTRIAMLYGFGGTSYQIPLTGYATFSHNPLSP